MTVRERIYHALEVEAGETGLDRVVNITLISLIVINVAAVVLETVRSIAQSFRLGFDILEAFSVAVFTVEYLLRVWTCVERHRYRHPVKGRLRFIVNGYSLVDLAAIIPAYLPGEVFLDLRYARVVRLMRMLRLLKISRYSRTVQTFTHVVRAKSSDIAFICLFLTLLLVLAGSCMYFVEHRAQPTVFASIPASMWWGVETLTTVGYGDMIPVTAVGKILGALIAVIGIAFFALPAGVLAAAFAEELDRQHHREGRCPKCGRLMEPGAKEVSSVIVETWR